MKDPIEKKWYPLFLSITDFFFLMTESISNQADIFAKLKKCGGGLEKINYEYVPKFWRHFDNILFLIMEYLQYILIS